MTTEVTQGCMNLSWARFGKMAKFLYGGANYPVYYVRGTWLLICEPVDGL